MQRTTRTGRGCVWALIGLAALIALIPFQGVIWDGRFQNVECRLTFVDGDNKPVPGVALTVLTKAGGLCHFYPVDEFIPDQPVVADAEGRMVFHHSAKFLEFSGREYSNLIGCRFGQTSAPYYDCVFTLGGREVFRTPYNFHRREWEQFQKPEVHRTWRLPWDASKHGQQPDESFDDWYQRAFDANHDGVLDREEITAAQYFEWKFYLERASENATDRTFQVLERTITVPNP